MIRKTREGLFHAFESPRNLTLLNGGLGHRIPGRRAQGRIVSSERVLQKLFSRRIGLVQIP